MRVARWSAALLALPFLFGCEVPAAPFLVEGAQRFDPPPAYQLWWQMTQECSERRGLLANVHWYFVPGARTLQVDGRTVEGYWTSRNTIVLAEAAMHSGSLVRHEMLHSLQDGAGHPREFFLNRCGGVVLCDGPCVGDAEPLPPADPAVPRVEADALEIDVEIRPFAPTGALYGGRFTVIVTARNPRSDAVIATLPPTAFGEPSTTFEYRVETSVGVEGGGVLAWDKGVTRFAPGETKRQVFDFNLYGAVASGGSGLGPGNHTFYGAYGGRWTAAPRTVTIP
jgi:hypothetical protein